MNRQVFVLSNVVIIRYAISEDILPNPFFKQGFENICCLMFTI